MFSTGQAVTSPEELWPGLQHRSTPVNAMPSSPRSRRPYQHKSLPRQQSRRGRGRGGGGVGAGSTGSLGLGLGLGLGGSGVTASGLSVSGLHQAHRGLESIEASGSWSNREWRPLGDGVDASRVRLLTPGQKTQSDKCTQMPDPEPSLGYSLNLSGGHGHAHHGRLSYCQKRAYKQLPNETEEQRLARLAANRERARLRRANESLDERQRRLADNRERARTRRAQESEEIRFIRLADNRERARSRRALETEEQRLARLAFDRTRARERRIHETADERDLRLADGRARGRSRWMNETEEQRRQRLALFREKARVRRVEDPTGPKSLDMQQSDAHHQEQQLLQQLQQAGVVGRSPGRAPRARRRGPRAATTTTTATSTSTSTGRAANNGLQQDFGGHEQQPMNSGDQEIRLVEQLLAPGNATAAATVSSAGGMSSVAYPPNGHTGPFYSSRSDHLNAPCSACYPLEPFIKFNQGKQLLCEGHSRLSQGLQMRHQEFI